MVKPKPFFDKVSALDCVLIALELAVTKTPSSVNDPYSPHYEKEDLIISS